MRRLQLALLFVPVMMVALALAFGGRWVARHQNVEVGTRFLEQALKLDSSLEAAFHFLRDAYGKKGGDWNRVLGLAEEAVTHAGENGELTFLLAQAGTIAWRELGNLSRARTVFERLSQVMPEHPQVRAFEQQIGESLAAKGPASSPAAPHVESTVMPPLTPEPEPEVPVASPAPPQAVASPSAPPPAAASAALVDEAKIAELRATAEKQEAAKRFNEYVKTILQLATMVPDDVEKVSLYMKAADLYVGKFANQAEAVKAYEAVILIEPDNTIAIDYLRQMYEKRRDWEKLLGLQRREADALPQGAERAAKFHEIAKLATERVKKPEVCIELWQEVLKSDDSNVDALGALSQLYERSKEFEQLAAVLEKQAEVTYDSAQKIQILNKLGTIYGDRLNNDEGAVTAWRTLLTLDPNDRKAQEALKKKYLALGRWDDLEVFYAESGKWDEFIRVLEQQEAKEANGEAKIGMLFKIAELWADKKQKTDRAAKSYEKVLELEPNNLRAAERRGGCRWTSCFTTTCSTARRRLPTPSRSSSATSKIRSACLHSCERSPRSTRGRSRTRSERSIATLRHSRSHRTTSKRARTWSAPRRRPPAGTSSSRATIARSPRQTPTAIAISP